MSQVAQSFLRAFDEVEGSLGRPSCRLLLENAAGTGRHRRAAASTSSLALIDASGADARLGVCIDTQHLFASGIPYSTRAESDEVVSSFDAVIGLDRLGCLHLNDSKVPLGSNRDRHENLGDGEVGATALGWLLSHPALDAVPALLEVPGDGDGPRTSDVVAARTDPGKGKAGQGKEAIAARTHRRRAILQS